MIKIKRGIQLFLCISMISGCSSISKMSENISSSIIDTGGHIKQMTTEPFKEEYSDNHIIEKSLYDGFNLSKGVLQMYGRNENYSIKIKSVNVSFEENQLGPMTAEFHGMVMIDALNHEIETPITFMTSNILGTKYDDISGHKYRLESIILDRVHAPLKHSYEDAFRISLQNLVTAHLNDLVLIKFSEITGPNKKIINTKNFKDRKYNPKINYVN